MAINDKFLTISQAAEEIGVTAGRVRQMICWGEIQGEQIPPEPRKGRWLIPLSEVKRVAAVKPTTGRPRKSG